MIVDRLNTLNIIDRLLSDEYAKWTYEQAEALADWLQSQYGGDNSYWEFNNVQIRSEWSAYENQKQIFFDYSCLFDEDEVPNIQTIKDETEVILCEDNTYLVRVF